MQTLILIDTQNVHMGIQACGRIVDRRKFFWFLQDKFDTKKIVLFIWYLKQHSRFYEYLQNIGYEIAFKNVVLGKWLIKGNIDSHLVLKATRSFYEQWYDGFVLVSWDGDFDILVEFLLEKKVFRKLLVPNIKKASQLLKNILPAHDIQDLRVLKNKLAKRN